MPTILFIHENFPAQFGRLAQHLHEQGWKVLFATAAEGIQSGGLVAAPGYDFHVIKYGRAREIGDTTHRYLRGTERAVLNGQGLARLAARLDASGFKPDIVMAHSGWGSGSMAKVIWPRTKFVQYLEWWYSYPPVDVPNYDDGGQGADKFAATLCRNLPFLLDCQTADAIWVPTEFQASQIPDWIGKPIEVIHDGVDCNLFRPKTEGDAPFTHEGLPDHATIITYATRGMEPTRGFPEFMRELSQFQKCNAEVHAVIGGEDSVHYGTRLPEGDTWKNRMLAEYEFDQSRLHFVGRMPLGRYRQLLRRSAAHVYLTQPFVPSWSLLEAMACACPIITNEVAPVAEVLNGADKAILVDMDEEGAISDALNNLLGDRDSAAKMGQRARQRAIEGYELQNVLRRKQDMLLAMI